MPLRSEWSWTSEISVSFFSLTSSAILRMTPPSPPFLTMNGSSVTTIASRLPRICSIVRGRAHAHAAAAGLVRVADAADRPRITPPVGKSGPFMCCIRPVESMSGLSMKAIVAAIVSLRLCGGMFVAMPTAMPDEPLTSRFGKRAGSTDGSCSEPS